MEEKKTFKCASCGAGVLDTEKQCSYCGSVNPNFVSRVTPEIGKNGTNISEKDFDELTGMLGGLFGGAMMGGTMRRLSKTMKNLRSTRIPRK